METFLQNVPVNPRFLYRALSEFLPEDTVAFFESRGLPTKVERGRRVFPVSDKARDVTDCLVNAAKEAGVRLQKGCVKELLLEDGAVKGIVLDHGKKLAFDRVILATGGASYPLTGSTGDGYRFAKQAGHTVIDPKPSLVPLVSPDPFCKKCMGLSLKNVGISFVKDGKTLYEEQGEMMLTHFGVTGPVILSASAHLGHKYPVELHLDMKPALDHKTLENRLLREFAAASNKDLSNCMGALLPSSMIPHFLAKAGIDGTLKVHSVTKEIRKKLCDNLKNIAVTITGTRPIEEAIVTSGGVKVTEIDPRSMESKLVSGLFFAGEVLDVDAYTGGYNLQIAYATGRLAGVTAVQ
jgi:predicted Rossmann fold flavoprotein